MPRVTVITGYYNRAAVVERTLSSVLHQTYSDFDFIAFDDASTDDTLSAMESFAQHADDARLEVRGHTVNVGFVAGLKEVIDNSDSEYIAIQGSGDVSAPTRLSKQVELLDSRPEVGAVGSWYYNIVEAERVRRLRQPNADDVDFASLVNGKNVFSHGEVMIRRDHYEAAGGYRTAFKNAQDLDLWLRLVRVSKLATVREPLYERYVQFDGVSYNPRKFPTQMKYSIAARELAMMSTDEAVRWLPLIEEQGPAALVTDSHRTLQKRYLEYALRSAILGAPQDALEVAQLIRPAAWRSFISGALRAYASPVAAPLRSVARRGAGVSAGK